ncbi:MAG: hypothetical protein JW973_17415 [Bacteroidales bacterium]|nr:hypothetical protein [Bacteroidales bacterium]
MKKTILRAGLYLSIGMALSCHREKDPGDFVTGVDIEAFASEYLSGYDLQQIETRDFLGMEYFYMHDSEGPAIRIIAGVYKSGDYADSMACFFRNMVSIVFVEGTYHASAMGDKCWYTGLALDQALSILFIRKNALFIISGYYGYPDVTSLAQQLDEGIMQNAVFVNRDQSIRLPVIDSVTATKTLMKAGETSKITLHASDPRNEPLAYVGIGIGHYEPDPENVFTVIAHTDFIGKPFFGAHVYQFLVINAINIVSETEEFEITISP